MFLPPSGSEFYDLTIVTVPQITGWEASFDGGVTWVAAVTDGNDNTHYKWLLAGPTCVGEDVSAVQITTDVQPLVRATAAPEIVVRKAPYVSLSTPAV